ncbi:hypothetical protein [Pseudomonas donghuensis]|uniref:hypothetical protein n=1 Tax=Pseudomonas donghuensis TaxID=1163398 RepID=UPI002E0FA3DA|nr:hypothetical protein VP780_14590 [Pseudomonas donghuensis]
MSQDLQLPALHAAALISQRVDDPRPWYLRFNQVRSVESSFLIIPYWTPLNGHPENLDGGITAATLTADANGLLVIIEPYLGMALNDELQVYWGAGQAVLPSPIIIDLTNLDQPLFAYVPASRIANGISEVWFELRPRVGGVRSSARLRIKVKRTLPGGVDPHPGEPGHQGLAAPQVPPNLIDEQYAQLGVEVYVLPWANMAVGDIIELSWGSVTLRQEVRLGQVNQTIEMIVDYDRIIAAGDSDELEVKYRLFDDVGNVSAGWSPPSYAQVEAGGGRLPAPVVREADANGYIDLDQLNGLDVTVQVYASITGGFRVWDIIQVQWRGFTATGLGPLLYEPEPFELQTLPYMASFTVPNQRLQDIPQGYAEVTYELRKFAGGSAFSSRKLVRILGALRGLQAPTVLEAEEGYLPDTLPAATVRVKAYPGMARDQVVRMIWDGRQSNNQAYHHAEERLIREDMVGRFLDFSVPARHIALLKGGTVNVHYRVLVSGNEPLDSEHLFLHVGDGVPVLVQPSVDEAENDAFDPTGHAYATVRIRIYDDMLAGQTVHVEWSSAASGGTYRLSIPVTVAVELTAQVPVEFIIPSLNREVYVRYWVTEPGQRTRYSDDLALWVGVMLVNPPTPYIAEAEGNLLDLARFTGNATVTVEAWRGINILQRFWLRAVGKLASGADKTVTLANGVLVQIGEVDLGIRRHLSRSDLHQLMDLSELRIEMTVTPHGSENEAEGIAFPQPRYVVQQVLLTTPSIDEARGNVVDLADFTGDATVTLDPWRSISTVQRVWLRCRGTDSNNQPWLVTLANGVLVQPSELQTGIIRRVSRSDLLRLANATSLRVEATVTLDGSSNESSGTVFPTRTYSFMTSPVRLAVSSGGLTTGAFPHDWVHPRESNHVTVVGLPQALVTLSLSGTARFTGNRQSIQVTLDSNGEAQEAISSASTSTTLSATQAGRPTVTAVIAFRDSFPADGSSGTYLVKGNTTNGALANGRGRNRVSYDTVTLRSVSSVRVSLSGSARFTNYSGQVADIPLRIGTYDIWFDVVNTRAETITVTFELPTQGSWARFTKTMTFT